MIQCRSVFALSSTAETRIPYNEAKLTSPGCRHVPSLSGTKGSEIAANVLSGVDPAEATGTSKNVTWESASEPCRYNGCFTAKRPSSEAYAVPTPRSMQRARIAFITHSGWGERRGRSPDTGGAVTM